MHALALPLHILNGARPKDEDGSVGLYWGSFCMPTPEGSLVTIVVLHTV